MIIKRTAAASVLALMMSATAHAEIYLGGNIGMASPGLDEVDDAVAFTFVGGFQIPNSPIFFEGTVHHVNDADVENDDASDNDVSIAVDGFTAGVGLRAPRESKDLLGAYFKLGTYFLDVSSSGSFITNGQRLPGNDSEKSQGIMVGAGFDYPLAKSLYLTFDITGFIDVDYLVADEGVGLYALGAKYEL